jgi:hypothetical protein
MVLTKPWGGCYVATVKPFRVALVEPVAYLKSQLRLIEPSPVGNVRGLFILARFSLTFCPENDISASKLIGAYTEYFL